MLPSYTSTDIICKELNVFSIEKLFKKRLLLLYRYLNIEILYQYVTIM